MTIQVTIRDTLGDTIRDSIKYEGYFQDCYKGSLI